MINKKSKRIFSCLLMAVVLLGTVWTATNLVDSKSAYAAPFIKLDYGEKMGKSHVWWSVDKGSLTAAGKMTNPILKIRATLCDEYCDMDERYYSFSHDNNGEWVYRWDGWTGKHAPISSGGSWKRVKGDRLANDILYIATCY